jgi:DNA helicase-2/ATP-dependent DNA helicase PcrA
MVGMEEGLFPHSRSLDSLEDIEEERRLCYVGMTRAEEELTLSFVQQRSLYGASQYHVPSRFLDELPPEHVEKLGQWHEDAASRKSSWDDEDSWSSRSSIAEGGSDVVVRREPSRQYAKGSRVKHPIFGLGIIEACESSGDGEKLTIRFQMGQTKKILTKYANLTVIAA